MYSRAFLHTCTCRAKKANLGVLTCTVYIYVHCTNVPVYVPCTCCLLAESVRVTPVLTDPVAVEVVAQAAVCEPERVKEVPVIVEEALGGGGVIVATLEPLGATANEITAVNRMYMHVYRCTVHTCTCRANKVRGPYMYCIYMYTVLMYLYMYIVYWPSQSG